MNRFELVVPCHFGLEAVVKREIYDLGYEITRVEDGRVSFEVYASGCSVCQAPCGRMEIYEMEKVWKEPDEDIKSLKSLLLFGQSDALLY